MTSQIACKIIKLRENINFLTLKQIISISFEEMVNLKKVSKMQNLNKHGIENRVTMATSYTLDKIFFRNLVLHPHFSKSGKVS